MKDIIHVHTTFMCTTHVCLDWCGAGTGYLWNGKIRGTTPNYICVYDKCTVCVYMTYMIHVCTSRVKYQYQYVYQCSTGVYTTVLSTSKPKVESTYMYEYV